MRNPSYPPSSLRFDWIMALLSVLIMFGVMQDGWAHSHGLVDQSFFTPWHAILYSCMALAGIVLGVTGVRNLLRGYTFRRGLPVGYWTSAIGVLLFVTGGVFDLLWHTIYGIETDITALVSFSHLWLALGGALVFSGPIQSIAYRYDRNAGGWKITGPAILSALALLMQLGFFTQYASLWADDTAERVMAPNHSVMTGGELYTVRADGSRETRLLTMSGDDIWGAAISPDGTRVAYRVQTGGSERALIPSDLYVANADGTSPMRITHDGNHDTQVSWSPDGKQLAYVAMPARTSGKFSIVVMNADGSNARKIVDGTTTVQNPMWSPDGASIVFSSRNGLHQQLAVVPSAGGTPRWLAATLGGVEPSWSSKGEIVFAQDDGTLATTDARGTQATTLKIQGSEPAFSPDGKLVAYSSNDRGVTQIFVANADGSHPVNVTQLAAQDASHPAWRSNNEVLFTAAGRPRPIYTFLGKSYSMNAAIISSLIMMGTLLLLVRRWRMPLLSMTFILGVYAIALSTQSDTYWDIPAALLTGVIADAFLVAFGDRARSGNGFYAFGFIVPFVSTVAYTGAVYLHDGGLGWPPNLTIGAPFISGFVGLLVAFCYAPPLAVGAPVAETRSAPSVASSGAVAPGT